MIRALPLLLVLVACAHSEAKAPLATSIAGEGCRSPDALAAPGTARVDGATAKRLVADGARLVDVRAPDFYAREHIAGAVNIPVAAVGERAGEIGPPETPVVLYCRTGAGSAKAARILASLGYTRVYDLGSYLNWGEGAPAPTPLPPTQ